MISVKALQCIDSDFWRFQGAQPSSLAFLVYLLITLNNRFFKSGILLPFESNLSNIYESLNISQISTIITAVVLQRVWQSSIAILTLFPRLFENRTYRWSIEFRFGEFLNNFTIGWIFRFYRTNLGQIRKAKN